MKSTYNINVAHDAAHIVIQSSETITVTSASLQADGFTVNQTPSYFRVPQYIGSHINMNASDNMLA